MQRERGSEDWHRIQAVVIHGQPRFLQGSNDDPMDHIPVERGAAEFSRQADIHMQSFEGREFERGIPASFLEELEVLLVRLLKVTFGVHIQSDEG